MRAARDGLHTGAAQYALVNVTPIPARRSMFGVLVCLLRPRWPTQWFKSSTAMKSTFGFFGGSAAIPDPAASKAAATAESVRRITGSPYRAFKLSNVTGRLDIGCTDNGQSSPTKQAVMAGPFSHGPHSV